MSGSEAGSESSRNPQSREKRRMAARPQAVGEPKSRQQEGRDDRQRLPVVAHDVMLQFVADGEFDLVRRLDRRQVALQNDAIGRAETIYPGAVAADKNWDVTHAAARGRRFDPRFERAIVERLIGCRERFDPYRQNDQSQKCERNQRKGTIEPPAERAFYDQSIGNPH
jgi:hypothetical protein